MRVPVSLLRAACGVLVLAALAPTASAQKGVDKQTYERGRRMLEQTRDDLRKYYYDSTFHGLDLDASYTKADAAMAKARNNNELFAVIAQFVSELNDSHTNFYPPPRATQVRYGFGMQFFGDTCYITSVAKGSDAEKKGVKVGDALVKLDLFRVERGTFETLNYVYRTLSPRAGVKLYLKSPDEPIREVVVMSKIVKGPSTIDYTDPSTITRLINEIDEAERTPEHYYRSLGDSVIIWQMPSFVATRAGIDEMMKRVGNARALVLDLRGNGGGLVSTEMHLVRYFTDHELNIMTVRDRAGDHPRTVQPISDSPYRGMLVILVDSYSASASEITARILQLEGRAIIVGDRSMGAVVTSRTYGHEVGFGRVFNYAIQISVADVIMPDGNRLEGVGVIPDELVLPSGHDLAAKRDPALARALELVNYKLTPEEAGKLFASEDK